MRITHLIFLLGLLTLFGFRTKEKTMFSLNTCEKQLANVVSYYDENFNKALNYRTNLYSYNIEGGETTEKMKSTLEKCKEKFHLYNPFLEVFQDEHTIVVVVKDAQTIILRNNEVSGEEQLLELDIAQQIDTLEKFTSSISCNDNKIMLTFSEKKKLLLNNLEKFQLTYNPSNHALERTIYFFQKPGEGLIQQITEYTNYSQSNVNCFSGTALDQVVTKGMLKKKYNEYRLRDLRNKDQ